MPTNVGHVEVCGRPPMDDEASIHDVNIVRQFAAEVEILFDQHDGDAGAVAEVADGAADVLPD